MGLGKPISKWAMQETTGTAVADSIGANTGTATSGNARRFNGTSDYVTFANPIIPLGAKSIRFKIKKAAIPAAICPIIDNCHNPGINNGSTVSIDTAGKITFTVWATTSYLICDITSQRNVCDGFWHEILISWDGTASAGNLKIFIDDMVTPNATNSALYAAQETTGSFNLAMGKYASAATYGGFDIDDLQITNAANGAGTVVAWWKMDDAAATAMVDSSSNAWVATITGTTIIASPDSMPIIVSDGAGGYARRFNGRSDRITYTNQVLPLGVKSIRFKIRSAVSTKDMTILDNRNMDDTKNGTTILISGGNVYFQSSGTTQRFQVISPANVCDNNWHEVLCTWDGTANNGGVKIFVDDFNTPSVSGKANSTETTAATYSLMIGKQASTDARYFDGDLKDIQINVGTGTERTDPKDLQIGDFIAASYVAASGAFGTFSNLGISPTSYIPPASSATPNGGFYLMYVGDDFAGRKILISDRNIQNSISWDTLNTAGVAAGSGLPIPSTNPDAKVKLTNPASLPPSTPKSVTFSADGVYMSVASDTTPFITIYKRSGDTFTKLADPAALPASTATGVAFSADGMYMSVAHDITPFITIYKRSGDTFTKLADPATLPTGTGRGVTFSADGVYMSVAHSASPFVTIYKRSGDTFTKLVNPAALPASAGNAVTFSADGVYMSVGHGSAPFVTIYKRSGDTFTKLADPAVLPASTGNGVAFSTDGVYMSVAHPNTPYITIYKRSGDTFTKLANPAALPPNTCYAVAFSQDGVYMSVGHASAPNVTIYKRSGDVFAKLADPAALPAGTGNAVAFSPDGVYMSVAHATTPFITIYKTATLYTTNAYGFTARLLTGGISATDTDNEWDRHIVSSTLGGTITAGDNSVWNWSGIRGWTSTVFTNSGTRVIRGSINVTNHGNDLTATATAPQGFRPVLLIESLASSFVQKYLFQDGTDIKKYANSAWSIVGAAPVTEAMFTTDGMTDLVAAIAAVNLLTSRTPKVFSLAQAVKQAKLTALPPDKLILPTGDIDITNVEGIDAVTLTANQSGAGKVRVIVSTDGGASWRAWSTVTSSWVSVPPTAAAASTNGMTAAVLNARTRADWDALFSGIMNRIRFGYLLSLGASTDVANTDLITAIFDMRGSWDRAIHGTDYVYGYPANTLLRVKLLSNGDFKIDY